jgi:4a-hydroxytetrahydrobiopterin dehydratase
MSQTLVDRHCKPCEGGVAPLTPEAAQRELAKISGWTLSSDGKFIRRHFSFTNFTRVMPFVNAVAYIAEREGHHPDVTFGYNYCDVSYTTHAIDGLSDNDFICAAKVNRLLD